MDASTIILCGGSINYVELPIGTNLSNAMVPVSGRPVIAWILDDLLGKGIRSATIVLRQQDHRLHHFLARTYARRMNLSFAFVEASGSILDSLRAGLSGAEGLGPIRLILGDTLIRDPFDPEPDFVYVGEVEDSHRWCIALTDDTGTIVGYEEKPELGAAPCLALAGYYRLESRKTLERCLAEASSYGERQLSDVLRRYGRRRSIRARPVAEWFDFGNIDNLVAARHRLLAPRYFNSLTVNPILNTITKVSENNEKLRDELNWYKNIPEGLRVLTPRLVGHTETSGRIEIVQEHYGYPTLAELYVFGDLHPDAWRSILTKVCRIHEAFRTHHGNLPSRAIRAIYLDKTKKRLSALREQHPGWDQLLGAETVSLNGRKLHGLRALEPRLELATSHLIQTAEISVVHGDFCFSNILFDITNQIIRLIDPRGSFGQKGVFGDPRYDVAKLRHSVSGLYDYILADMFELSDSGNEFTAVIHVNGPASVVATAFDEMITKMGYVVNDIKLIEGLLFLSMLPLHRDRPLRQRMMFLNALVLLNEALEAD